MSHAAHSAAPSPQETAAVNGEHGMMMHSMVFHFGSAETILFSFWDVESPFGIIVSCLVVLLGCVLLEGIRWFRAHRSNGRPNLSLNADDGARKRLDGWLLIDTLLHAVQLFLAYAAMLVFMTFNLWLCAAVIIGEVGAHLAFRLFLPHLDAMNNSISSTRPCCS
ncbi:Copper transport protein [Aphelenchoides fujianensis]|nr:Copper transport protein [Aphelenchoides fujianensis]